MTIPPRRNLAVYIGLALVGLGLVLNGTTLESTIFPYGTILGTARRALVLRSIQIALIGAGAYVLFLRPRVTSVHLAAFGLMSFIAGCGGAALLQVAYTPPPILSGWKAFAPAIERHQLGFRGRQISYSAEDHVTVLLGDSHVEAMALTLVEMPERRLESHLIALGRPTKVFSIAAGGYGQDQELLALQEYFKTYRADLVVVWQTPSNDIWNNVFNTHMGNRNPKPTFWLDDAGRLAGPTEALGEPLASSQLVVAALWQRTFGLPWRDKSWERGLPAPYMPLDRVDGPVLSQWQQRWDTNLGRMRDENLATEKSHFAIGLSPRSKRMQYGLDLTRALLHRIRELTEARGGKLVVFQVDTREFASERDQIYALNGQHYRYSERQQDANWKYVNDGFDTEIIHVTIKNWRVSAEDAHLNAEATNAAMADLAERLRSRIPEQRPIARRRL